MQKSKIKIYTKSKTKYMIDKNPNYKLQSASWRTNKFQIPIFQILNYFSYLVYRVGMLVWVKELDYKKLVNGNLKLVSEKFLKGFVICISGWNARMG